jgi:hypothetical protein
MMPRSRIRRLVGGASRPVRKERARYRPCLELLEDRLVPRTFVVTNSLETGLGSLQQAILNANGFPGRDTIEFNVDGDPAEVHTIQLVHPLPAISDPVVIDGYSQPGAAEGLATFSVVAQRFPRQAVSFRATATSPGGNTSVLSNAVPT